MVIPEQEWIWQTHHSDSIFNGVFRGRFQELLFHDELSMPCRQALLLLDIIKAYEGCVARKRSDSDPSCWPQRSQWSTVTPLDAVSRAVTCLHQFFFRGGQNLDPCEWCLEKRLYPTTFLRKSPNIQYRVQLHFPLMRTAPATIFHIRR